MSAKGPDGWWRLRELHVNKAVIPVIPGTRVTAHFRGGAVSGSGGCNSYEAEYVTKLPQSIRVSNLVHTLVFCEGPGIMEQEKRYFDGLVSAEEYRREGEELWLTWEQGSRALVYVAEEIKRFQGAG